MKPKCEQKLLIELKQSINLKYSIPGSVVPLARQGFELQSSDQLNNIGLSFTSGRNIANQIYIDAQITWKLNFHPRIKVDLKEKSEVSLASGSSHCLSVGFSLLRNIFFLKQVIIFWCNLVSHTIPFWVHLHLPPPSLLYNYWACIIVVNVRNVLISLWHCQRKGKGALYPPPIPLYGSESASLASLFLAVGNSMQCIPFSIEVTWDCVGERSQIHKNVFIKGKRGSIWSLQEFQILLKDVSTLLGFSVRWIEHSVSWEKTDWLFSRNVIVLQEPRKGNSVL